VHQWKSLQWLLIGSLFVAGCAGSASREPVPYSDRYLPDQAEELASALDQATVEPHADGVRVVLPTVDVFADAEANVQTPALDPLVEVADILVRYDGTEIAIAGHTNVEGAPETNRELSRLRAQAVANVLAANGVEVKRMSIIGLGESEPLTDPETAAGQLTNPRLELVITPRPDLRPAPTVAVQDSTQS
jgi:outer membrane protein OmpA-like peptidoglycan-associated protein